jgi:chorismate lyase
MAIMNTPSTTVPATTEWLPAEKLGQASIEPGLRHWLIGQGLLTLRLKAVGGEHFRLQQVEQFTGLLDMGTKAWLGTQESAGLFREVTMSVKDAVWVYAQTIVPDDTLADHPWIAELGDAALGETLVEMSALRRSSYEFARLPASDAVAARALASMTDKPTAVWARRSRLMLRGKPLLVQELFLPAVGRPTAH